MIANDSGAHNWIANADPDASVIGFIFNVEIGDVFLNTISGKFFRCYDNTYGSQIWVEIVNKPEVQTLIAAIPQANWTQSNSSSSDYIKNKPSSRSQSSASRTLNTIFQPNSTRDVLANYSVDVSTSATLLGGQTGTVFLEISLSSTFASGIQELARFVNGNSVSLAIAITLSQNVTGTLSGYIPAGYYCRLRTDNTTGTPSFAYRSGQEVLL